ncbi:MAG: DUF7305 domain-containing protein [Limisphaerales bacterium]
MKILRRFRGNEQGNTIAVSLVVAGVVGYTMASYLTLVRNQNLSAARSQSWNVCIPVLEAGIEEALTHLYYAGMTNLGSDGWVLSGTNYIKQRDLGGGFSYVARISTNTPPAVSATGYAPVPLQNTNIARTVVCTTKQNGLFSKGMVAKGQINLSGNNIKTDSFDSMDPNYSTQGLYDPAKAKDNGDVATDSGLVDSLSVGNANIAGHVSTGPGGSVSVGANGAVGSKAWQQAGNHGVEAGWSSDDMNVSFPDVPAPFVDGYSIPASGSVGGTNYTYVLNNGNYELTSLSLSGQNKVIITGNAVLYVTGNISMAGNASIAIATNASLALYVGTANTDTPVSASLGGNGIINNGGNANQFYYYGLPSNNTLALSGNAAFTGAIYAPAAAFTLGGGGNNTYDFVGGSVTATATLNGHYNFHYDENLGRTGPVRGFIVTHWGEYLGWTEI